MALAIADRDVAMVCAICNLAKDASLEREKEDFLGAERQKSEETASCISAWLGRGGGEGGTCPAVGSTIHDSLGRESELCLRLCLEHISNIVNTRYRHTLGTPQLFACNVVMFVTR